MQWYLLYPVLCYLGVKWEDSLTIHPRDGGAGFWRRWMKDPLHPASTVEEAEGILHSPLFFVFL